LCGTAVFRKQVVGTSLGGGRDGGGENPAARNDVRGGVKMDTITRETGSAADLGSFDAVICGGGLSGWAAAVTLARAGRETLIASERTALGFEVWGALSLWEEVGSDSPGLLTEIIEGLTAAGAAGGGTLDPVATEVTLDRIASDAGVKLLVQVYVQAGGERRVLLTGKWGLMSAGARVVVDAMPTGTLARESGGEALTRATDELPLRRMLIVKADLPEPAEFEVPADLPVSGGTVLARIGRYPGDVIVEARLDLDPASGSRFEIDSRRAMNEIAAHLRASYGPFAHASLVQVAHDAALPRREVLRASEDASPVATLTTADGPLTVTRGAILPEGTSDLALASPAADFGAITTVEYHQAANAILVGEAAATLAGEMIGE